MNYARVFPAAEGLSGHGTPIFCVALPRVYSNGWREKNYSETAEAKSNTGRGAARGLSLRAMDILRLLKLVAIALAVVLPGRAYLGEPIYVASPSMEPALKTGTLLVLDKLSLRTRDIRRGDILSFRSPVDERDLIKRVIAVPGETVELREKLVFINGKQLDEPYVVHLRPEERLEGDTMSPLVVPKDSYFVLGDNRDESNDSSVWKDADGNPVRFVRRRLVQGLVRRLPWA